MYNTMPGSLPDPEAVIKGHLGEDFPLFDIITYHRSAWERYFYVEIFRHAAPPNDTDLELLRRAFDRYLAGPHPELDEGDIHDLARHFGKSYVSHL